MSFTAMVWAGKLTIPKGDDPGDPSPATVKLVLLGMANNAREKDDVPRSFEAANNTAIWCGLSKRQVYRAQAYLADKELITLIGRTPHGTAIYRLELALTLIGLESSARQSEQCQTVRAVPDSHRTARPAAEGDWVSPGVCQTVIQGVTDSHHNQEQDPSIYPGKDPQGPDEDLKPDFVRLLQKVSEKR